jgi:GxxExxY protein
MTTSAAGYIMTDYLYKKESYTIIGAALEVYNELGPGFLEVIYHDAMKIELSEQYIPFESEKPLSVSYRGHTLAHEYFADLICYERILVELKAQKDIHDAHLAQVMNYLKATGLALGYVINFGNPEKLLWKRVLMSDNLIESEL